MYAYISVIYRRNPSRTNFDFPGAKLFRVKIDQLSSINLINNLDYKHTKKILTLKLCVYLGHILRQGEC